jgi:hypothetical protein
MMSPTNIHNVSVKLYTHFHVMGVVANNNSYDLYFLCWPGAVRRSGQAHTWAVISKISETR